MDRRPLGRTGLRVSPIGFGAFKIGRNAGSKYPRKFDLPDEQASAALLQGVLDLGINLIDTAPAYGLSEERIGAAVSHRRKEFVLSSKVGETFENDRSSFDFSSCAVTASVERSLKRLRTDVVDLLLIHSDGRDLEILRDTDVVPTLQLLKDRGLTRFIGLSGKTLEGARAALAWADVLMIELNIDNRSHEAILAEAQRADVGLLVKKGLASGHRGAEESVRYVLSQPSIASLVVGSLSLDHLRANLSAAFALGT